MGHLRNILLNLILMISVVACNGSPAPMAPLNATNSPSARQPVPAYIETLTPTLVPSTATPTATYTPVPTATPTATHTPTPEPTPVLTSKMIEDHLKDTHTKIPVPYIDTGNPNVKHMSKKCENTNTADAVKKCLVDNGYALTEDLKPTTYRLNPYYELPAYRVGRDGVIVIDPLTQMLFLPNIGGPNSPIIPACNFSDGYKFFIAYPRAIPGLEVYRCDNNPDESPPGNWSVNIVEISVPKPGAIDPRYGTPQNATLLMGKFWYNGKNAEYDATNLGIIDRNCNVIKLYPPDSRRGVPPGVDINKIFEPLINMGDQLCRYLVAAGKYK